MVTYTVTQGSAYFLSDAAGSLKRTVSCEAPTGSTGYSTPAAALMAGEKPGPVTVTASAPGATAVTFSLYVTPT
jgi:hypothetical protein